MSFPPGGPSPTSPTLPDALHQAYALHRAGEVAGAEQLCRTILAAHPTQFDALHLLGIIAAQRGHLDQADRILSEAVALNPASAEAHSNLGNVWKQLRRFSEALASYDRALAIQPDLPAALCNRGAVLNEIGRCAEALASVDRALSLRPNFAEAYFNRGVALQRLRRLEDAIASFDRAVSIRPNYAQAWNQRGYVLHDVGRYEGAIGSFDRALAESPGYVAALNNRGVAEQALGRLEDALASFDEVLALRPDHAGALGNRCATLIALARYAEALECADRALGAGLGGQWETLINRGLALQKLGRAEEALESIDRALARVPDDVAARNNRAAVLRDLHRFDEGLSVLGRILDSDPRNVPALTNTALTLCDLQRWQEAIGFYDRALSVDGDYADALQGRAAAYAALGRHDAAIGDLERLLKLQPHRPYAAGLLLHAKAQCAQWRDLEAETEALARAVRDGAPRATPLVLLGLSDSPAAQLECAKTWVRDKFPGVAVPLCSGQPYRNSRIRVAYLSADLHEHPIAFLLAGVFEEHDRSRFDTIGLSFGPETGGEMRARLKDAFERFFDVRQRSDRDVATLVRELKVDILVDLMGHTLDARTGVLALRPAPIQVHYLGYPGTMGASYVDYMVADRFVVPASERASYSEKIAFLPEVFQGNDSRRRTGAAKPLREGLGLPGDGFVFCSFNASYKVLPVVFDVWMRLLRRVPGSVLWLNGGNDTLEANLRREARARSVAPDRLVFAQKLPYDDHLARYGAADLFLDTLPFNAGATASDALWMGLPVLTCAGRAFASRMAGSLLHAVGLPELVADSLDGYEELAFALATQPARLAELRARLARHRGERPLFDTARFCRHLEGAYQAMWERHQRGDPPADLDVAARPQP